MTTSNSFCWSHRRIPIQGVKVSWGWMQRCVGLCTYKSKTSCYHELVATSSSSCFFEMCPESFCVVAIHVTSLWLGQAYYWWIQIQIATIQEVWRQQMGWLGWRHIYVFIWELVMFAKSVRELHLHFEFNHLLCFLMYQLCCRV
jgi:hypothetical protein